VKHFKRKETVYGGRSGGGSCWRLSSHHLVVVCIGLLLGMCESVRTRNTLYEVGAAKS
jgi:hypothetical protein